MLEAVFISDLHLHPNDKLISERFNQFIDWVANKTTKLYILGDFFHAWPGDDGIDSWSRACIARLNWLTTQGIAIYFIQGNRDFLIGSDFAQQAGLTLLVEPAIIHCAQTPVLLVHGDRYCTKDKAHQWFRRLTRNRLFTWAFLKIPFRLRYKMVNGVRQLSQANRSKSSEVMDIVPEVMLNELQYYKVSTVIHGHTHKPGLTTYHQQGGLFNQYILSDWDDNPKLLCYHKSKGFYFVQMNEL